ncbi:MAG TPA: sigma-54 dependent transcriptional regulator [Longimicrobium sp.]|jgi:DNA-binding NtrC family response regulator|uniref:sigma-54-dependent transcriptional regulator n=1 Tax=Longimicrobium sp. TaxID=2029185 RepID=UPI002ED84722
MDLSDTPPRVLVADDRADILQALRLLLRGEAFEVVTAASPAAVAAAVAEQAFDAVLLDLNYARDTTSGKEGMDLLTRVNAVYPELPIVVMTAWGSVEGAVEAMRRGARDYVEKPWDNARLVSILRAQVELGRALRRTGRLEEENRRLRREGLPELIGDSRAMQPVRRIMERVAPSDANVLITGEHGTGKEVVAAWLHAASNRASKPLVTVNAGGISEGVFESELFGHVKGAFTDARADRTGYFEMADGGTLFLDEIGNLSPKLQAKLLRVLQTGEFQRVGSSRTQRANVRILSATNADLAREITEGRFREDLLYRLNTVEIRLPPLRERRDDVPLLASHFLRKRASRYGRTPPAVAPEAMQALLDYAWPGNIRELEHTVERALLMMQGDSVQLADLALPAAAGAAPPVPGGSLDQMPLEEVERVLIRKALQRHDGNVSQAAEALGLSRSALYRRLQRYGL